MKTLDDLLAEGVAGRTVLVRSDLNVPLDGEVITDDGRAQTLDQALLQHDGEARTSRDRFATLSEDEKQKLRAFLRSL